MSCPHAILGACCIYARLRSQLGCVDYCNKHGLKEPQWGQEIPNGDERKHKVWVVIGKMKFEADPLSSLSQAQEKVAGKVVDLFKMQGHAETIKMVESQMNESRKGP